MVGRWSCGESCQPFGDGEWQDVLKVTLTDLAGFVINADAKCFLLGRGVHQRPLSVVRVLMEDENNITVVSVACTDHCRDTFAIDTMLIEASQQ